MTTQRRMDLIFKELSDSVAEVEMLHEKGWNRAGNWNFGQILDHLNIALRFTFGDIPFFMPMPIRGLAKFFFWPTIKSGRPIRLRGIAPKKIQPRNDPNEAEMVVEFKRLVEQHYDSTITFAPIHPAVGKLDRQGWLLIQKWHVTHHLSFMVPTARTSGL